MAISFLGSQRLRVMLGDDCFDNDGIVFANTTPKIGIGSASKLPIDGEHVSAVIVAHVPDLIVACGEQASRATLSRWSGDVLCVPHPASRLLTNDLYREARRLIAAGDVGCKRLVQCAGCFETIDLDSLSQKTQRTTNGVSHTHTRR